MSTIAARAAIVETFKTELGAAAKHVAAHPGRFTAAELARVSANAPAVFVACLAHSDIDNRNGSDSANVSWAAFIVTKDIPVMSRDEVALTLVDRLKRIIPGNRWGLEGMAESIPRNIRAQNLFSADVDAKGVAMWALSWQQDIADTLATDIDTLAEFLRMDTVTDVDPEQDDEPSLEQTIFLVPVVPAAMYHDGLFLHDGTGNYAA